MRQSVRKGGRDDSSQTISSIPRRHADRLLSTAIPVTGDDAEERETAAFEETEEESSSDQPTVAVAGGHGSLCDSPAEA